MKWNSISKMPSKPGNYAVLLKNKKEGVCRFGGRSFFNHFALGRWGINESQNWDITHWKPLDNAQSQAKN